MKKSAYISFAILALCSCTKPYDPSGEINLDGYTMVVVDTEEIQMSGQDSFSSTWQDGDCIGIFGSEEGDNLCYTMRRSDDGQESGHFYGPLAKGQLTAYYPYNANTVMGNGKIPFTLSATQVYDENKTALDNFLEYNDITIASMAFDGRMHFRYPLGMVAFNFAFEEIINIKGLTLEADRPLAGMLYSDSDCNVTGNSSSARVITVDMGGATVPSRVGDHYNVFYCVLPPAEYAAKSLALHVETDSETMSIAMKHLDVKRINCSHFEITTVTVGSGDIPGFNVDNGFLE